MENYNNEILKVRHSQLERADNKNIYRSKCIKCEKGILLIMRNKDTFLLEEFDICISCGQKYEYLDINELRNLYIS